MWPGTTCSEALSRNSLNAQCSGAASVRHLTNAKSDLICRGVVATLLSALCTVCLGSVRPQRAGDSVNTGFFMFLDRVLIFFTAKSSLLRQVQNQDVLSTSYTMYDVLRTILLRLAAHGKACQLLYWKGVHRKLLG